MLGNHLREFRELHGLSQEDVAKTLNVSRQAISKWENTRAYPDIEKMCIRVRRFSIMQIS